jgi:fermentation-respiration switch protein FrsA (DUF1100 family)
MILVAIVLALYFAATGALYALQRRLLFAGAGGPPVSAPVHGLYRDWLVEVPGGPALHLWRGPAPAKGMPIFVFFHGNGSDTSDFAAFGERFAARGWGVVLATYRGYSGNAGAPSEAGLMADARAILAALDESDNPLILWGHSLGSGVAARMAAEGHGAGLVLEAPYTSIADVAQRSYPIFPVQLLISDRFDTMALLPDLKIPVLIFHSADDRVVPFDMGQRLATALGTRATSVFLNDLGHVPHSAELTPRVAEWLAAQGLLTQR